MNQIFLKKLVLACVICCFATLSVHAQSFSKGCLAFLKNQSQICITFDFSKVTIDGASEASYVKKQMAAEKTTEEAENWKKEWYGDHRSMFTTTLTDYCNSELKTFRVEESCSDAVYTIIVKIEDIDPGNFAGPFSNPSKLRATFKVVKTGEEQKILAMQAVKNVYDPTAAMLPVEFSRINSGFGELGKELAKQLKKAMK